MFGSYIAGLIEGDGSIIVREGSRAKVSPAIVFTFHEREMPLYKKLKDIFNSGSINKEKSGNCRYRITNANAVIEVINLVNGKFRTPKIEALGRAIDNLNKWRGANLSLLPLDTSDIGSNAWLAGFSDSDGNFFIRLIGKYASDESQDRGRVQCVFSINQREINKRDGASCIPFMEQIAKFFGCNLNHKTSMKDYFKAPAKAVVFYAQSDTVHQVVTGYFDKYPLMSSKYLNYLCYKQALNYLGRRLTREETLELRNIKSSMNDSRTEFHWEHLNNNCYF